MIVNFYLISQKHNNFSLITIMFSVNRNPNFPKINNFLLRKL